MILGAKLKDQSGYFAINFQPSWRRNREKEEIEKKKKKKESKKILVRIPTNIGIGRADQNLGHDGRNCYEMVSLNRHLFDHKQMPVHGAISSIKYKISG